MSRARRHAVRSAALALLVVAGAFGAAAQCPFERWDEHVSGRFAWQLDHDGAFLWVGTNGGGVLRWDPTTDDHVQHSRVEDCLASNVIADVAADPTSGDVWVATDRGLSRLTGGDVTLRWETLDETTGPFGTSVFTAVEVAPNGDVWAGTFDEGAWRFDGTAWEHVPAGPDGVSDPLVTAIVADAEGHVWFGVFGEGVDRLATDGTWTRFDPDTTEPMPPECTATCSAILSCPPDTLGLISFFAEPLGAAPTGSRVFIRNDDDGLCGLNAVSEHDDGAWRTWSEQNSAIVSNFMTGAAADESGVAWITSPNGTSRLDGDAWTTFEDARAHAVALVGDAPWLGTGSGLLRWDAGRFVRELPGGLAGNKVADIAVVDAGATAWLATDEGVQRFDGAAWETFDPDTSELPTLTAQAIVATSDGTVWAATQAGGVARRDGASWTLFDTEDGLCCPTIHGFQEDAEGRLWAHSSFGGISRWDGAAWTTLSAAELGLPTTTVRDMALAPGGALWFATPQGACVMDDVETRCFTRDDGLPSNAIQSVIVESDGTAWIGSTGGVSRFDGVTFDTFGVGDDHVRALAIDAAGRVWAGARDGGAAVFEDGAWTPVTMDDGIAFSRVFTIAGGADGRVWFGTELGLSVLSPPPAQPGAVPDGALVSGAPLRVRREGAQLRLEWSPSCSPSVEDYAVHVGRIGLHPSHEPVACSTLGASDSTIAMPDGDAYVLVVPLAGGVEGSHGRDSSLVERPRGASFCSPEQRPDCP